MALPNVLALLSMFCAFLYVVFLPPDKVKKKKAVEVGVRQTRLKNKMVRLRKQREYFMVLGTANRIGGVQAHGRQHLNTDCKSFKWSCCDLLHSCL